MATDKQIAANRANAQRSTGPSSPAGLEKSSQNRRTHGLCGNFGVLACEGQENYDALLAGLMQAEKPADPAEIECVVRMAEHLWRAKRALRMQDSSFNMEPRSDAQKAAGSQTVGLNPIALEHGMRYHTLHERAYQRAWKELSERRKQRQLAEIGFESQKRAEEKHEQQKAQREARELRAQAEERRGEQRQKQRDELHTLRVVTAQADFELKSYKVFDRNPNFTPPGVLTSAA